MLRNRGFTIKELAVVTAIFLVMLVVLAPFVRLAKERKARVACAANLMEISLGLHSYSADHGGIFPPALKDLYPEYVNSEKVFDCPATKTTGTGERPEYVYTAGLTELSPPKDIIVQDADANHRDGKYILRLNGSVEWSGKAR